MSYDIADDKRRADVANELENFGLRVQKSVFECFLNAEQFKETKGRLETKIDFAEDQIRYYYLCKKDFNKIECKGRNVIYRDEDYFMI